MYSTLDGIVHDTVDFRANVDIVVNNPLKYRLQQLANYLDRAVSGLALTGALIFLGGSPALGQSVDKEINNNSEAVTKKESLEETPQNIENYVLEALIKDHLPLLLPGNTYGLSLGESNEIILTQEQKDYSAQHYLYNKKGQKVGLKKGGKLFFTSYTLVANAEENNFVLGTHKGYAGVLRRIPGTGYVAKWLFRTDSGVEVSREFPLARPGHDKRITPSLLRILPDGLGQVIKDYRLPEFDEAIRKYYFSNKGEKEAKTEIVSVIANKFTFDIDTFAGWSMSERIMSKISSCYLSTLSEEEYQEHVEELTKRHTANTPNPQIKWMIREALSKAKVGDKSEMFYVSLGDKRELVITHGKKKFNLYSYQGHRVGTDTDQKLEFDRYRLVRSEPDKKIRYRQRMDIFASGEEHSEDFLDVSVDLFDLPYFELIGDPIDAKGIVTGDRSIENLHWVVKIKDPKEKREVEKIYQARSLDHLNGIVYKELKDNGLLEEVSTFEASSIVMEDGNISLTEIIENRFADIKLTSTQKNIPDSNNHSVKSHSVVIETVSGSGIYAVSEFGQRIEGGKLDIHSVENVNIGANVSYGCIPELARSIVSEAALALGQSTFDMATGKEKISSVPQKLLKDIVTNSAEKMAINLSKHYGGEDIENLVKIIKTAKDGVDLATKLFDATNVVNAGTIIKAFGLEQLMDHLKNRMMDPLDNASRRYANQLKACFSRLLQETTRKPRNIVIDSSGNLIYQDYDGNFVVVSKGMHKVTVGDMSIRRTHIGGIKLNPRESIADAFTARGLPSDFDYRKSIHEATHECKTYTGSAKQNAEWVSEINRQADSHTQKSSSHKSRDSNGDRDRDNRMSEREMDRALDHIRREREAKVSIPRKNDFDRLTDRHRREARDKASHKD